MLKYVVENLNVDHHTRYFFTHTLFTRWSLHWCWNGANRSSRYIMWLIACVNLLHTYIHSCMFHIVIAFKDIYILFQITYSCPESNRIKCINKYSFFYKNRLNFPVFEENFSMCQIKAKEIIASNVGVLYTEFMYFFYLFDKYCLCCRRYLMSTSYLCVKKRLIHSCHFNSIKKDLKEMNNKKIRINF